MSGNFKPVDNNAGDDELFTDREKGGPGWKILILLGLAIILVFALVNSQIFARSSTLAGGWYGGGSCCGGGRSGAGVPRGSCCGGGGGSYTREQLAQAGVDYYRANFGEEDVEAEVEDFGCHQEIVIYRDGEAVRRFSFVNGTIYDITR